MFALKLLLATFFVVASARHVPWEDQGNHEGYLFGVDEERHPDFNEEDLLLIPDGSYHPGYLVRSRRQAKAQGSLGLNSDGVIGVGAKIPLIESEKNRLSAIGSLNLDDKMQRTSSGLGLALDNVNGHSLSVMKEHVPGFGDKLTGAGKFNLYNYEKHNFDANAFITRNRPDVPNMPSYNTVGGGLDYMYKNRVGASLGLASTPFLGKQEYSAMGNLNLYRDPTSTFDFSDSMSSGWQPAFGLSFSKYF